MAGQVYIAQIHDPLLSIIDPQMFKSLKFI